MSSGYPTDETLPASRAIDIARWATIVATCSVMVSPPLANAAMAVMLIGLLASGQAGVRLRQACTQPLGIATLLLISVIGVAMLWGDAPWRDRWAAFWSWRKLWMIPVALALFGPLYWKRRLAVAYVAVCGVAMIASFVLVAIEGRLPTMYELALSGSLLRNHSAQSMAFATAAFVALWLAADPYWRRAWRLLAAALAALFVLNMAFITPGRSGFLALAVMLAVLAAFSLRSRRMALAVLVLAAILAGAIALSPLARDRINLAINEWNNASTQTYKTSMGMRAVIYGNTLELVRARPWFGTGTGGYGGGVCRADRAANTATGARCRRSIRTASICSSSPSKASSACSPFSGSSPRRWRTAAIRPAPASSRSACCSAGARRRWSVRTSRRSPRVIC